MKKYFILAVVVLVIGAFSVYGVLHFLPQFFGTQRNQHSFIDQLENQGWVEFDTQSSKAVTLDNTPFAFNKSNLIKTQNPEDESLVILSFWASWCSPCIEEFPSMIELANKFPGKIQIIAVSEDYTLEDIQVFIKGFPQFKSDNMKIIWDKEQTIVKLYQVSKMPEAFIFNSKGKLVRKVSGSIRWADPDALDFFTHLLKK